MSRLSDVIGKAIESNLRSDGTLDAAQAANSALGMLDAEDIDLLAGSELRRRIKEAMAKARRSTETQDVGQAFFPFPDIRLAHPLDLDGRKIKLTAEMREIEFRRVIAIREASVEADMVYLDKLREAYRTLKPVWDVAPDLTFSEACDVLMRVREGAA